NNVSPNNNNHNPYNTNAGNTWFQQNRELNNNNNNNAYSNPNSPYFYNSGHQKMTSCLFVFLTIIVVSVFHI
ncbi:unnamed protein product, partial [Rotaria sp. Silwood2]